MGYVLNFWRYADETAPRTPEEHVAVMNALYDGEDAGALPLPVARMAEALSHAPGPDWQVEDGFWTRGAASIEFDLMPRIVHAELRGPWEGADANLAIELFSDGFGLPLFDPQLPERFETSGEFRP